MLLQIVLLILGFVLLIFGADRLVNGASSLARNLQIPDIVIGLTIVALGTSAPEMVVNVIAASEGSTDMVLGNILGSNIINVLVILGITSFIHPLTVKYNTTWIEIPLSLLSALLVLIIAADVFLDDGPINIISRSEGVVLLLFFTVFMVYNLFVAKNHHHDYDELPEKTHQTGRALLFVIIGLAGLVFGGRFIVNSAVNIASTMGVSQRIISLTVVALGTSLPELATSIVAVSRGKVDLAIGNVVGSNLFNVFLILGISTIITPALIPDNAFVDILLNLLASFMLFIFLFTGKGRRLERWEGAILILLYLGYLGFILF